MKSRHVNDLRVARLKLRQPGFKKLPRLIRDGISACAQIVTALEKFPELGSGRGQRRFLFGHPNRERHLRRLEAIAKVLACLLSHMDLVTLRAGKRRRDGSCDAIRSSKPYGKRAKGLRRRDAQTSIEEETGMRPRTIESALRDLRSAGYVTSHQPKRDYRVEGERRWRSFPVVNTVTKTCLGRLGVDLDELEKQRQLARVRQEQGPRPIVDVRLVRERQRLIRGQAIAAKHADLTSSRAERMVKDSSARVDRMYRRKRE